MTPVSGRFAAWPAWGSGLLIALFLLLSAWGAGSASLPTAGAVAIEHSESDLALYQAVAERVEGGEDYYEAVVAEQRARGYPLRPVFTVRLPTLAWTVGTLGERRASLLLFCLMIAAVAAATVRMREAAGSRAIWAATAILAAAGAVLLTVPAMTYWHESWAGLLILLSLACRSRANWWPSLLVGLLAVFVRELALPYLGVMAVLAWRECARMEAAAWAGAALLFLAALAVHASALSAYVTAADPSSPGWAGGGGWAFVLGMMQRCSLFLFLPLPFIACLVPLSILGWASLRHPLAERATLILVGYLLAFTFLGRADNFYWGILIAPLLPIGLAFAPRALRDAFGSLGILNLGGGRVTGYFSRH